MPIMPLAGTAAPRGALVPIAQTVIRATNIQQFDFNNIPQIYQDLRLVVSMRTTGNNLSEAQLCYLNVNQFGFGDSNYSQTNLIANPPSNGSAGSPTSNRNSNPQRLYAWNGSIGAYASPNLFGTAIYDILNYRSTAVFKTSLIRTSSDTIWANSIYVSSNLWRRTAAITQLSIFSESGAGVFLAPGSTATLYGVRSVNQ